ncbi:MAG: 23S rRNA (adenine(2503)-C(2))-methyltransferase RlmN [Chlorobiaceae bacterium]
MTQPRPNILDLTLEELRTALESMGEPQYRAAQIHQWLFSHRARAFVAMSTLGVELRRKLAEAFVIQPPEPISHVESADEECGNPTEKILLKLHDGELVETVLIRAGDRRTACVSSQAGCALGCIFCATGKTGLKRNLSAGEIIAQVQALNDAIARRDPSEKITNIVFMGMGEPLLNTGNVIEAIETLTSRNYRFSLSRKKITISTVGIIPEILRLGDCGMKTKLAVSLHSANQEKRESLMPLAAKSYPLAELRKALADYTAKTGMPVTIVYMLLDAVNDSPEEAKALARFAHGFLCKINLIDYNSINIKFKPVNSAVRDRFQQYLQDSGLHVTVRKSYGTSINAACGQLAASRERLTEPQ